MSLWNYLKGYVIVEVSGHALEKFINLAIHTGIHFWDVERREGKLYVKTTIPGFKKLKPYAHKAKCRVKIIKKVGLPFIGFRYRRRNVFIVGSFVFVVLLYVLTSFVWLVEVEGNQRLSETDIVATLEKNGYTTGKLKNKLDLRRAEQYLVNEYTDISWAGVKFEGTKLVVQVAETVPKPQMHDETVPCDLIAKRDALITYIATDKGMPKVKKGDTVKKGETLVSGKMTLQDDAMSLYYTHSKANIKARTLYALEAKTPLYKVQKNYTGNIRTQYSIKLFNKKIPLYTPKCNYEKYVTLVTINQLRITELFPLPLYFEKEEKVEYTPSIVPVDVEVAKETLEGALHDELTSKIGVGGEIIKKEITYSQSEDTLIGVLTSVVEEDITEAREITQEEIEMDKQNSKQEGVSNQ